MIVRQEFPESLREQMVIIIYLVHKTRVNTIIEFRSPTWTIHISPYDLKLQSHDGHSIRKVCNYHHSSSSCWHDFRKCPHTKFLPLENPPSVMGTVIEPCSHGTPYYYLGWAIPTERVDEAYPQCARGLSLIGFWSEQVVKPWITDYGQKYKSEREYALFHLKSSRMFDHLNTWSLF